MKLKSSILILALLVPMFAFALPKFAMAADPQFSCNPDPKIGHVGDDVSVAIKLDQVTDLNAWQFKIRWDQKVLKYKSIEWGWLVIEDVGDFNLDYVVDSTDLGIMGAAWGSFVGDPNWNSACDLMPDGVIDSTDLGTLGAHWGHFGTSASTRTTSLSVVGNELDVFEGYTDPLFVSSSATPVILATITWTAIAGGSTPLAILDHFLWKDSVTFMASSKDDGLFYTLEPFVTFSWTPTGPRIEETITFNATGCASADGDSITGYSWSIDGLANGTGLTTTGLVHTYSKVAHDVALTVSDSGGHSYTLHQDLMVNRDLAIFTIFPSIDDMMGTILFSYPVGKTIVAMYRSCNLGSISEMTDNSKGDFAGQKAAIYLIHSDGTEEQLHQRTGVQLRRYVYAVGPTPDDWQFNYDWAPIIGVYYWCLWDTSTFAPENGLYLRANITDPGGDTDLTNNQCADFGPFNLTAGYAHDIRLDGIWSYDAVSYYQAMPPYPGLTFKYFYGPYAPGAISDVTVGLTNVGQNDETDVEVYVTVGSNAPGAPELPCPHQFISLAAGEYNEVSFAWDTTLYYGEYNLYAHIVPVTGETVAKWNTWDNNVPGQDIAYWNGYDTWGVYSTFP
jgi:hypothetical protein